MKRADALDRLKRVAGSYKALADALDLSPEHVSRMVNGRTTVPEYIVALAELLDVLPPKDWPARWQR
jgi:plasmid maintenance system antidote protein VapI